jgi:hypothetical protein
LIGFCLEDLFCEQLREEERESFEFLSLFSIGFGGGDFNLRRN